MSLAANDPEWASRREEVLSLLIFEHVCRNSPMVPTSNASNPLPGLLSARRLPARLTAEQAAEILGFKVHDIPLLVRAGLMKPLGGGPRNSVKYFHADEVEGLARDRRWLDKATRTISRRAKSQSISTSTAAAEQSDSPPT